ncbi:MAG: hypothetical protein M3552_09630 [Planctomycetota bacterium]|nr:hypothetical protein [Planctomycetaceae bacterium]MDQ3330899.1 hypothetical protein [Planctomycetota bacterium]
MLKRSQSRFSWLAFAGLAVSFTALCVAVTRPALVRSWLSPPLVVLVEDTVVLEEAFVGTIYHVPVPIRNRSDRTVRIVGGHDFGRCGPYSCRVMEGLPLEIPPHSTRYFETKYQPSAPGVDDTQLIVYTDHPTAPQLAFHLQAQIRRR